MQSTAAKQSLFFVLQSTTAEMFLSKCIATFIFMSLLHAASGSSCCQHPPGDISEDNCRHVIVSKTEQPASAGLQIALIIPPQSCSVNITEHAPSNNIIVIKSDSEKKIFGRISEINGVTVHLAGAEFSYMRLKKGLCPGQCIFSKGTTNESVTVEIVYVNNNPGITFEFYEPKENTSSSHHNHTQPSVHDTPQNQQPYLHNGELRRRYPPYGSQQYAWKNTGRYQHRGYAPPKNRLPGHNNISHATYYRRPKLPYHRPSPYNSRPYRHYLPGVPPIVPPNTQTRLTSRENRTKTQLYNNWNRGLRHPVIIPSRNPVDYNRVNYRHYPRIIPNRINNRHIYNPRINKQHFPRIPPRHDYKNKPLLPGNRDLSVKQHPRFIEHSEKINLQHSTVPEKRTHLIDENSNTVEFYDWKIAGFTECSRTCGGGIQQTRIVCVKIKSQVTVTADNCNNSTVPAKQKVTCNTGPCQPSWQTGNWSSCSTSCGPGTQTRTIECTQILSPSTTLKVSAERCNKTPRPAAVRQCQNNPCGKWLVKAWGRCKPECGQGSRRKRLVKCVSPHLGTSIPGRFCPKPKPHRTELCQAQHCPPKWYVSKWSNKCSSNCGSGFTTRQVICVSNEGNLLSSSRCDREKKPEFKTPCSSSHPCGGIWFTGAWSECSADCGKGQRTREVACLKKFGLNSLHVVSEENCQDEKPVTQENCVVSSCDTDWFLTEWSECSSTCGEGQQTRQVKCFNKEFKPSTNCTEMPPKTKKCNLHSCRVPSTKIDHSCIDKYGHKNCQLVMRARLCNNPVYKQKCCVTCSQQNSSLH
ncbi:type-1 domain-containing 4-like [Octopus vulgaris]|uniref:Type-1 domain-containing 4-like n=1 Tax=Octopus vulgaris TaxID=6645 RepID=A0AA36BDJ4_OCTVU|nr:type-1 domain-containing 4-like [Octopus vulgaris]